MIISKTPFRISLFGGGTDLPHFLKLNGKGATLGFSINKYCYIMFRHGNNLMTYNYRFAYSKIEFCRKISEIEHPTIKNCIKYFQHKSPFDLLHNADLPARTGLGSSSSFAVGLCNIFNYLKNRKISDLELAKQAIYIEQKLNKESVGSQDQILTSLNGLNFIEFKNNGTFQVIKKILTKSQRSSLESNIHLVYTGIVRYSSKIENDKQKKIKELKNIYFEILDLVYEFKKMFFDKNILDIQELGRLLDYSWQLKKRLSKNVSNSNIDELYDKMKKIGIYGGKLIGAGGGGFILIIANNLVVSKLRQKIKNKIIDIKISDTGSEIIYNVDNIPKIY
jgi:D-glycero-alpha-D-manno-heptose-7-phosphate kinase